MTFNESLHPISLLEPLRKLDPSAASMHFEFSRYVYRPQEINDDRQYFIIPAAEARQWFFNALPGLKPDEDIAFHSRLLLGRESRHIPMIDFKGRPAPTKLALVAKALSSVGIDRFVTYDSGRSLHLYGIALLTHEEWVRFLGRILLLNLPDDEEVVDVRWVGHRIMAGYGTLRWTKNNPHYLSLPTQT